MKSVVLVLLATMAFCCIAKPLKGKDFGSRQKKLALPELLLKGKEFASKTWNMDFPQKVKLETPGPYPDFSKLMKEYNNKDLSQFKENFAEKINGMGNKLKEAVDTMHGMWQKHGNGEKRYGSYNG